MERHSDNIPKTIHRNDSSLHIAMAPSYPTTKVQSHHDSQNIQRTHGQQQRNTYSSDSNTVPLSHQQCIHHVHGNHIVQPPLQARQQSAQLSQPTNPFLWGTQMLHLPR